MSGHSKWHNIQAKKGKADAARGKIFTKIGREIAIAVREGGSNPDVNGKLRDVIAKAKANNMPNDNITRSIKKAAGEGQGENYKEGTYEGYSFRQILLALFEELLQDEVLYLQKQEEHLAGLEEELLKKIPDYFYEMIMKYRKRFNIFHAYYEQLMNMGDVMQTSVNGGLSEEEKAQWQLFSNRAERLHDHVEMLREYLVQIRELYQSLIAVQQNQVMSILTVVTTIFLPLTLIAGWYGMNFPNMPEFGWKYAYPAVIIVSILVIILEIIYFKKKKML